MFAFWDNMNNKLTISDFLHHENNNLDLIRLVCATLVIWGHLPAFMVGVHNFDIFSKFFNFTYMGAIAVKAFFLISGMLVTNSLIKNKNGLTYLISRFFRIWPAMILCVFISAVFCYALYQGPSFYEYQKHAVQYVIDFFVLKYNTGIDGVSFMTNQAQQYSSVINGSLWTIPIEVTMYLLTLGIWFICSAFTKSTKLLGSMFLFLTLSPIIFPVYGGTS